MGAGSNDVLIVVKSKEQAGSFRKTRGEVKGLHADVMRASVGFKAFGGFFRTAVTGIAAGGVAAFAAVGAEMFRATKGWADHKAVVRDTANTIKQTGGVAKVTTAQVSDLADAIERKTTKDGDAIQSGANMLLTFKGIRNEAGKNNDIFNQATSILTDMTAKMNQGSVTNENMSQSAIQLGKALDDPIAGMSALHRVGVDFNDAQKEQIKTLVESGDKMGAQKIILKELSTEFAGAAKASAKPWDGVVVVLRQVEDAIGAFLLPKVQQVSNWILDTGLPALGRLKKEWDHNKAAIQTLAGIIVGQFVPAGDGAKGTIDKVGHSLGNVEVSFDRMLIEVLKVIVVWLKIEAAAMHVQIALIDVALGAALATSAFAHLRGGSTEAADKVVADMRAMKAGAQSQLDGIQHDIHKAQGTINSLHGRVIQLEARDRASQVIDGIIYRLRGLPRNVSVGIGALSRPGRPTAYQTGTMSVPRTGGAIVHKGEIIIPPDDSEQVRRGRAVFGARGAMGVGQAAAVAAGGAATVVLEIRSGGSRLDDLLVELLRKSVRARGGDVQVVLGT
jgi:hypothetical protein